MTTRHAPATTVGTSAATDRALAHQWAREGIPADQNPATVRRVLRTIITDADTAWWVVTELLSTEETTPGMRDNDTDDNRGTP